VSDFPRFEPPISDAAAPYWDATREKRLLLQWCDDCDTVVQFPRAVCPICLGTNLSWRDAAGTGTIYALTIEHRPQNPRMASRAPYAVALVDLDEGARLLTNIVTDAPDSVSIGQRVRVTWEELSDGRCLPLFEPAA
jgi:uncharacterized OB-fold protein